MWQYYNGIWTGGATCRSGLLPNFMRVVSRMSVSKPPQTAAMAGGTWMGMGLPCDQADCPEPCVFDVTGDGVVNFSDLIAIINNWGLVCP